MTVNKPRRARWRALGGRRDYWEHCASIIASHLEEEEKQEISQEEAFYLCKLGDAYIGVWFSLFFIS